MMAGNDCYWQKGHRSHSSCHHTHTHTHLTALYPGLPELKAEVQRKLRVDKQQQLEGMCVELEAVNRLKRKFQEALPDSQIYD